jgi:hypothetical protein
MLSYVISKNKSLLTAGALHLHAQWIAPIVRLNSLESAMLTIASKPSSPPLEIVIDAALTRSKKGLKDLLEEAYRVNYRVDITIFIPTGSRYDAQEGLDFIAQYQPEHSPGQIQFFEITSKKPKRPT